MLKAIRFKSFFNLSDVCPRFFEIGSIKKWRDIDCNYGRQNSKYDNHSHQFNESEAFLMIGHS